MSENNLTIPAALTIPNVENTVGNVDNSVAAPVSTPEVNYEELYRQSAKSIAELTAERDSLLSENAELRTARDNAIADGQKTKELNYTLARQLDLKTNVQKQPEEMMAEMFLNKRG